MSLLTDEEKQLPRDEKRALRKQRRHEKWGGPVPPWVVRVADVTKTIAQKATVILVTAATEAVKAAAVATLSGGKARHEFAVDRLLESARTHATPLARAEAAGLVEDVFSVLEDAGDI